jgi:hypothetical protein
MLARVSTRSSRGILVNYHIPLHNLNLITLSMRTYTSIFLNNVSPSVLEQQVHSKYAFSYHMFWGPLLISLSSLFVN